MTAAVRDFLFWLLFWIIPMIVTVATAYVFMSLPARRNERARFFLDLLETGLQRGESPERTILGISETRDRSVGVYFHLLAAHIEEGADLLRALEKTPQLLPPSVTEAIKIGAAENALPRLLPAARAMLNDSSSRLRGAVNYLVVFLIIILPAGLFLLPILSRFVWPKFVQLLADMESTPPAFATLVFNSIGLVSAVETILLGAFLYLGFLYVGGPRLKRWNGVLALLLVFAITLILMATFSLALVEMLSSLKLPEVPYINDGSAFFIFALVLGFILFGFYKKSPARAKRYLGSLFGPWSDRFVLLLPWRRQRMQRDFTGVLAILLDAGIPEARAVKLAARAPANAVFVRRSEEVIQQLQAGVALPLALKHIEPDAQFQWRWANALRAGAGFFAALRGWHESLEARAFQQEQAAAHAVTTGIVIVNGVLVGLIVSAVFLTLISIMDNAILW